MKIYFMKQKALDSLQAEVADNLNKYQSSSFWMDEHFINQNMPKYYFDTGIEVAETAKGRNQIFTKSSGSGRDNKNQCGACGSTD